ncbi:carbonic anhydrase [Aliterella atlantica]|uniref:carbonic anhydrase n=1 Tax=Aliterella atlantica CENA595 TaxID=1618023 RepID=A0A0D8ZP32_9CYAN|nr:carbonic anhydrase [Aliterella atlantica]KJH70505.1 carbonate dehydratase [Aliterella atlantica CENA595]
MNVKKLGNVSRRNAIKFGAGVVGAGTLAVGVGLQPGNEGKAIAAKYPTTPDETIKALLDGNRRFVQRKRTNPHQDAAWLAEVAKTQKPFASILSCADSRVPSEIIFDQGFGDLFVCRVAGNIATPEEIGSLEFGTAVLGSKVIMVMGHERCGAVAATIKGSSVPGQIGSLLEAIKPAVAKSEGQPGDRLENACKANVLVQIEKLKSSPVLAQLIKENKLKIVGGYYDLDTARVSLVS